MCSLKFTCKMQMCEEKSLDLWISFKLTSKTASKIRVYKKTKLGVQPCPYFTTPVSIAVHHFESSPFVVNYRYSSAEEEFDAGDKCYCTIRSREVWVLISDALHNITKNAFIVTLLPFTDSCSLYPS